MTMNPLPPQAYTKDILLKAYQWLMGQNSSIKEIATTPDTLVSLYLKATRDGDHALERPSIQNFKNELKSLAGMMGELDRPPGAGASAAGPATTASTQYMQQMQPMHPAHQTTFQPNLSMQATPPPQLPQTQMAPVRSAGLMESLDGSTQQMIQEVKDEFNLSTDVEAIRMLVKIGYVKCKGMLK